MLAAKLAVPLLFAVPSVLIGGSLSSSIALSSSPNLSVFGREVTLVAAVNPPTAGGRVTFYDGIAVLGTTKLVSGQATLTSSLLPSGSRSLKAYYGGDASYAPSTSATLTQTVAAVPGGNFQAAAYGAGVNPRSLAVGDFNGDGKADLAVANNTGSVGHLSVLLGNGDGTFQAALNYGGVNPWSMAVGDFNGDGKADLAVTDACCNEVSVLLGKGDGTFQAAVNYGAGNEPWSIAVGDFNGDGRPDLAIANLVSNNVSVLLGNGDGTFQAAVNYGAGVAPWSITVGDFNGDGKADLVVANFPGNNVSNGLINVLLGNGDGTFQAAVNYGAGNEPWSIAVGDFNGDGRPDLAVANFVSNNVSVLLGNGDGTFQAAVNYGAGVNPTSITVGDFNGDGKADLAVANYGSNNVSVLFGDGDGTFVAAINFGVDIGPLWIEVANFNGDGRADLAVANLGSNDVSVLLAMAPAPDLSIAVTHSGDFTQGQTGATYAITVSNIGSAATSGTVAVTDSLPPGLAATGISGNGWTCVLGTLTCTRGDSLAVSASYPAITVTVNVSAGAPGGVTNTVEVSGGGETNIANTSTDFTTTFTQSQVAQAWSSLTSPIPVNAANAALLMTDGTVMVHQNCSSSWSRLTPDSFGNYANGTWSPVAPMQPTYGPAAFSSAVLADGRLVVIGGEYNKPCSSAVETNMGAIYDPKANTWTPLSAPSGWAHIGDAANVVLPDGQFLLAGIYSSQMAKLDPVALTWTNLSSTGKADRNAEEGWTLLPDGTVLTIDTANGTQSERYLPSTDAWAPAGSTIASLVTGSEIGPQVLRPDGTVFVAGATGQTAVYSVATDKWTAGPNFPASNARQLANFDGPATLLPNGNVLVGASPFASPNGFPLTFFFEFDGTRLNPVPAPPGASNTQVTYTRMLMLPTGQVLFTDLLNGIDIYTPVGNPDPSWAPTIASAPNAVQPGLTYTITGTQFNGLSQAVAYGDDFQGATNYPLVRIVNTATGHVFYCRTHNHSTMGVATGSAAVSTQFDVPPSVEMGSSTLVVVANGIASTPWNLTASPPSFCARLKVSPGGQTFPAPGGPGTISITADSRCPWAVSGAPGWVTTSSASSGMGNGSVNYSVSANSGSARSGILTVAGQSFVVEQQSASMAGLTLAGSMAHLASGAGWDTTLNLVNMGGTTGEALLNFLANDGSPLQLPFTFLQVPSPSGPLVASTLDQALTANSMLVLDSQQPGNPNTQIGSAQLLTSGTVGGFAIFKFTPSGQEAVVPLETRKAPCYVLAFDNTGALGTGVAIANVAAQAANIPVVIRDDTGAQIGTDTISLPAQGHKSFTLTDNYVVTKKKRGTMEFDTPPSGKISALGLRTNGSALTTLPVLANVTAGGGSMAHVASGGGWQTTFTLVNTGTASAHVQLSFFDSNGNALSLPLTFVQSGAATTASTVSQAIAAGATLVILTQGTNAGAPVVGSAQLTTSGNVSGFASFRYNPSGQEAVVPLETRNATAYVLAFDNTNGLVTGVALANVSNQAASVPVILRDDTGASLGTAAINLSKQGHNSFLLKDNYPFTSNKRGTVEFDTPAGAQISVLGLRATSAGANTTIPVLAK